MVCSTVTFVTEDKDIKTDDFHSATWFYKYSGQLRHIADKNL